MPGYRCKQGETEGGRLAQPVVAPLHRRGLARLLAHRTRLIGRDHGLVGRPRNPRRQWRCAPVLAPAPTVRGLTLTRRTGNSDGDDERRLSPSPEQIPPYLDHYRWKGENRPWGRFHPLRRPRLLKDKNCLTYYFANWSGLASEVICPPSKRPITSRENKT